MRYVAEGRPVLRAQCHCRACQHISGGAPNLFMLIAAEGFRYTKGAPKAYRRPDKADAVTREFCAACGTHLITRRPGLPPVETLTNAKGEYKFPGVTGTVRVSATLAGRYAQVIDDGGTPVLRLTEAGTGGMDLDFRVNPNDEGRLAQVAAYCFVNRARDFASAYLPEPPAKLSRVQTHVNVDDTCNAFWMPGENSLNFFRSGGDCPNTAYQDVAYHEYGHGIDDELGGIQDGAYSEGFGDALAILITRDSIVGRNFFGPNKHLRDASQVVLWPDVEGDEAHSAGRVYGGFTWELTRRLKAQYNDDEDRAFQVAKELVLGAATHDPVDIPNAVRWSFWVDAQTFPGESGGNSKHHQALLAAAKSRKLPISPAPLDLTQP